MAAATRTASLIVLPGIGSREPEAATASPEEDWRYHMGTTARSLITGIDPDELLAELDGMHAFEAAATHWTLTVHSRLAGMALVLLSDEFEKRASAGLTNARRLAERIAQLGGSPTGDPSRFIELSPIESFTLPENCADIPAVLASALAYERVFVESYWRLCGRLRESDPATYDDLVHLLKDHIRREDDLETALGAGRLDLP